MLNVADTPKNFNFEREHKTWHMFENLGWSKMERNHLLPYTTVHTILPEFLLGGTVSKSRPCRCQLIVFPTPFGESWDRVLTTTCFLVGGLEHGFYFSIYWELSSQLTNIFQRGWNHQPYFLFGLQSVLNKPTNDGFFAYHLCRCVYMEHVKIAWIRHRCYVWLRAS